MPKSTGAPNLARIRRPRKAVRPDTAAPVGAPELNDEQKQRKGHLLSRFRHFAQAWQGSYYHERPHDEMADALEACRPDIGNVDAGQHKLVFLAPRYSYKTSMLLAFMVYCILYFRERGIDISIDYVRAQRELAMEVLYELKMGLRNNATILELWGDLSQQANLWKEYQINLGQRRDPTLSVAGLDFGGAGKHPDLVIIDDAVNEKNFDSRAAKRAGRNKIQAYYPILPPWGSIIDSGTRFSHNDLHGWLLDQNESDRKRQKELIAEGKADEAKMFEPQWGEYIRSWRLPDGELYFPTVLHETFIEKQRRQIEAKFFAAWYDNSPTVEGMVLFRLDYLQYFTGHLVKGSYPSMVLVSDQGGHEITIGEFPVRVTMTIDPTVTGGVRSDWTGMTVVACDASDNWWVLEAVRFLEVPSVVGDEAVKLIRKYTPQKLRIESSNADVDMVGRINRAIIEEQIPTTVESYHVLRDETGYEARGTSRRKKAARIEALEPRFRNGKIFLRRGGCESLYDQYRHWPDLDHDDTIDALAMQWGLAKRCQYRTLEEAERQFFEGEEDEPGQILNEVFFKAPMLNQESGKMEHIEFRLSTREPDMARRFVGGAGFSSQRLKRGAT